MNIENCCRVCLESHVLDSFSLQQYDGESTICDSIKKICPDINLDNKPDVICNGCLTQLRIACDFKQKCETSDLFLSKNFNFENKFQIFDDDDKYNRTIDDFIDTNLFDILDPDYPVSDPNEEDRKPDFDSLEAKNQTTATSDSQSEKRKYLRNLARFVKCSTCSETFSGPSKLIQHAKAAHQDMKPFKCNHPDCGRSYQNPKALKVHKKLHLIERPFKCDECLATFHIKARLQSHIRIHTGEKFKCDYVDCEKTFSTTSYLKQHQLVHMHGSNMSRPFVCLFAGCGKTFPDKNSHRSHQLIHEERKLGCEICGSKFRNKQSLKIHYLKHTDVKQFTCHICGVLFKYKNQCFDHVRAHTAKREFECFLCSKRFIKKTLLAAHMQTHLSGRSFNCKECDKSFKTYNCLYAHRRRHQEKIAKYSCASCDRNFTSRSDMTNHLRTHTQEKKFACHVDGCSKVFIHKANLNVHIRSHNENGFDCDICRKTLANSNALRVHLNKVHKAEKKYPCISCSMKFASPQLLNIHKNIHEPRGFPCTLCNQRYNFAADLTRHQEKMHQDRPGDAKTETEVI